MMEIDHIYIDMSCQYCRAEIEALLTKKGIVRLSLDPDKNTNGKITHYHISTGKD